MIPGGTQALGDVLRRFGTLSELGDEQLNELATEAVVLHAAAGEELLAFGSKDPRQLFLINGRIELVATDGARHTVGHDDQAAMGPISCLRPSRYRVTAIDDVDYLLIERQEVNRPDEISAAVVVEEDFIIEEPSELIDDGATHPVMFDVFHDMNHGRIVVPSFSDIAVRIGRTLRPDSGDPFRLSEHISLCPALTTKVLRAAISMEPLDPPPRTVLDAVEHLGCETTFELVVNCILRESLRSTSPLVQQRMAEWWQRTIRIATIARTLARVSERFNPEFAGLVGLLHSIAEPVMLGYADQHADLADPGALDHVIQGNRAQLGRILLSTWGMPREVVNAAAYCDYWSYDHGRDADYTDILLVAQWHAEIGNRRHHRTPTMDRVPAFRRLRLQQASPAMSLQMLERAKRQIAVLEARLDG